ncbi:ComEC/Rec2 family competence protein [Brachybacterium sp. DNPG3]
MSAAAPTPAPAAASAAAPAPAAPRSGLRHGDLRLLPGATAVWALAVIGAILGQGAAVAAAALLTSGVLAAVVALGRRGRSSALMAHLGLVLIACLLLVPALERASTTRDVLAGAAEDGVVVELALTLRTDPETPATGPAWARTGVRASARSIRGPVRIGAQEMTLPGSVPILLSADGDAAAALSAASDGADVLVRGRLRADGDLLILQATRATVIPRSGITGALDRAREGLRVRARAATAHLPSDEGALVRGMTTGDTHGLSEDAEEMMRRAGISHLVAVSGANIALVIAAVTIPLLLAGVRRRPRIAAAAVAMAAYVWLVGDEPSVQRAATMAAPLLAARFLGVRASPVACLALAVAFWSVLDPITAASIGFLLSALATAAILLAAPPLARAIRELSRDRLGDAACLVLAVPLVAQLACTPVLILLAPEISLWSVAVNMLVDPIVGPVTVIGLISLPVGLLWPDGAAGLMSLGGGGAHLVLIIARTADALPLSRIPVAEGAIGVLACLGILAALALAVATRRRRLTRWACAAVAVAVLAWGVGRSAPLRDQDPWIVAACAVGQGDAMLLRTGTAGDERTVLVDTGPDPAALTACLDLLGVDRIDLLVLTHPHADHTGGRAALRGDRLPLRQWICPIDAAASSVAAGVPAEVATTGTGTLLGSLEIEVLWPPSAEASRAASLREQSSSETDGANDCSIAVSARWSDGTRLVALGDLEPAAQSELLALDPGGAITAGTDLVKVAHHGSRHQDADLYTALAPRIALVTVGRENTFGHPTEQTLTMLGRLGAGIARTDVHGTVIVPAADPGAPRSVGPGR